MGKMELDIVDRKDKELFVEKADNMRKSKIVLLCLLCLTMTACSNEFAKREYDSAEKIAESTDHYTKAGSVANYINGEYTLTISKFNGRETVWEETVKDNRDIEVDIDFSLSKGQAKIVYIDSEDNIITLIECLPETSTDGFETKTLLLKSGKNRLKIVGYDCEDIALKMLFTEPHKL